MQSESLPNSGVFIDANLLVLLVVGLTDKRIISSHKRLKAFSLDDYCILHRIVNEFTSILVTPNILTEASNLLSQHDEPQRSRIMRKLSLLITESDEIQVVSAEACQHQHFTRLGLTDAGLLGCISADRPLVTVDMDLYYAASKQDYRACINFRHHGQL